MLVETSVTAWCSVKQGQIVKMKLEQLQTNAAIRGIVPDALVTVVNIQWFGSEALELTYKTQTGKVANDEFLDFLHQHVPHATREQVAHAWNVILLRILPQEVEFVHALRKSGTRTFLLSNTNAIHVAEFEQMIANTMDVRVFREAFEKIYYSNAIGLKKPHPETFLEVCAWNDLNPSETLFIDDSKQHVEGALRAGLHAYHLLPGERVSELLSNS